MALHHHDAQEAECKSIEKEYSVQWSEIVQLVSFEHSSWSSPDSMHNSFLGETMVCLEY